MVTGETLRDSSYRFGPTLLPDKETAQHFSFTGSTGSGKSTMLQLLMQDFLPEIVDGTDTRALLNNPKNDVIPTLCAIAPHVQIVTTDPYDTRGAAWDVARDINDSATAVQFAYTLIGERQESQPFFTDAARHLLRGALQSFIYRDLRWSIADLIRATRSPTHLKNVLLASNLSSHLVELYFADGKLLSNILATMSSRFADLEPVVAAWETADQKVSLRSWAEEEFVLVLGNDETSRAAMDKLNRAMFKTASDILLNQPDSDERKSWIVLDELSDLGKLEGLVPLCKKGRSKGARCCIAFQTIAGIRDPQCYGQYGAADLLGQFSNRFFGRCECPETAKWASETISDQDYYYFLRHSSYQSAGSNQHLTTRPTFLPSEFMSIDPCTIHDGLTGVFLTRITDPFMATIPGDELFDEDLIPPDPNVPERDPRPREAQTLQPWTEEQVRYFAPPQRPARRPGQMGTDDIVKDLTDFDSF